MFSLRKENGMCAQPKSLFWQSKLRSLVVRDDVAFCAVPVVGDNAAVYVFRTEDAFRFRVGTFIGDWRTLDHESQTHFRKHAVELEGRDAALLTPYVCFCPVRMFHSLGIS